jgi:predicted RNase H-related nuclease YkuK (DUF458 family)
MRPLIFYMLLVLAITLGLYWFWQVGRRGRVRRLRETYLRETQLSYDQAYGLMETQLERLMREKPGRGIEWYLEHLIADLRRDRR